MAATDEQKTIWSVLRLLLIKGQEWIRSQKLSNPSTAFKEAAGRYTPIKERELETHLLHGGKSGQFGEKQAIYIVPPAKETSAIAALWCRWDFDFEPSECAFYFGIWSEKTSNFVVSPFKTGKQTVFVGFRYETPEEWDNHDFYHAQPCRSISARDAPIVHALPLSSRYPTFPLAAESSLDLLLCLVVSLYGKNGLSEMREYVLENPGMRKNRMLCRSLDKILSLGRITSNVS